MQTANRKADKEQKMFVIRSSNNIEADLERGWSGWAGGEKKLSKMTFFDQFDDVSDLNDEELLELAQKQNVNLRFDGQYWREFHHNGLSAVLLNAGTLEDAILEGQITKKTHRFDFGVAAEGNVKLVHSFEDGYYILECDRAESEVW